MRTSYKVNAGILIALLLVCTSHTTITTQDWVLKREKDGIKVYTRTIAGSSKKELKLHTEIDSRLSAVVAYLSDKAQYKEWVYGCEESYMLKVVSELETYHYQRTNTPWPMNDRDLVVHTVVKQDPITKEVLVSASAAPDYKAEEDGVVRVRRFNSYWKFLPKNNKIQVEHFVSIDPGGDVPNWILNLAVSEGPFQTLKKFKENLKDYKATGKSSIVD